MLLHALIPASANGPGLRTVVFFQSWISSSRVSEGPVRVAEASAGYTTEGFDNFGYAKLAAEHKRST